MSIVFLVIGFSKSIQGTGTDWSIWLIVHQITIALSIDLNGL